MKIKEEKMNMPAHTRRGSVYKSQIDLSSTNLIMEMLAKLYTTPLSSALREYVSNAMDAHKKDNVTHPVDVTLPSPNKPMLIVRDYGSGLSYFDIITIYSNFGSSDKRNDNELIGGFGIGSKSGLAISDKIFVESIKDGLSNNFVLERTPEGIVTRFINEEESSSKPSGTTISIRVKDEYIPKSITDASDKYASVLAGWSKDEVYAQCDNEDLLLNASAWSNETKADINKIINDYRIKDTWHEFENGYVSNYEESENLYRGKYGRYTMKQKDNISDVNEQFAYSSGSYYRPDFTGRMYMGVLIGDVFYPVIRDSNNMSYVTNVLLGQDVPGDYTRVIRNMKSLDNLASTSALFLLHQSHVLKVDIGMLKISHSREKIIYEDPETRKHLSETMEALGKEIRKAIYDITKSTNTGIDFIKRHDALQLNRTALEETHLKTKRHGIEELKKRNLSGLYKGDAFEVTIRKQDDYSLFDTHVVKDTTTIGAIDKISAQLSLIFKVKTFRGKRNRAKINENLTILLNNKDTNAQGKMLYDFLQNDDINNAERCSLNYTSFDLFVPAIFLDETSLIDLNLASYNACIIDYDKVLKDVKEIKKEMNKDPNMQGNTISLKTTQVYKYEIENRYKTTLTGDMQISLDSIENLESKIRDNSIKKILIHPKSIFDFNTTTEIELLKALMQSVYPDKPVMLLATKTIKDYKNIKANFAGDISAFDDDHLINAIKDYYSLVEWMAKDYASCVLLNKNRDISNMKNSTPNMFTSQDGNIKIYELLGIEEDATNTKMNNLKDINIYIRNLEKFAKENNITLSTSSKPHKAGLDIKIFLALMNYNSETASTLIANLNGARMIDLKEPEIIQICNDIKANYQEEIDNINHVYSVLI